MMQSLGRICAIQDVAASASGKHKTFSGVETCARAWM
jgi:hypothetical protein